MHDGSSQQDVQRRLDHSLSRQTVCKRHALRIYMCVGGRRPQVNVAVAHKFSVEIDPVKRRFILGAHTPKGEAASFHLFGDVRVFAEGSGFCYSCDCEHKVPNDVDLLFAGPSCKNISKEFQGRESYAGCYTNGQGSSGYTYLHGVVNAVRHTSPAVLFFENVLGVAESMKIDGVKQKPGIEARLAEEYIYIYKHLYIHLYTKKL